MSAGAAAPSPRWDVGTIPMRRLRERELSNLAEGRPLKQWTRARLSSHFVGV